MSDYIEKNRIPEMTNISSKARKAAPTCASAQLSMRCAERLWDQEKKVMYLDLTISGTLSEPEMFDFGVSAQAIRDYGHRNENMTKQYIDYMPAKVNRANRNTSKNNLLLGAEEGEE